LIGGARARSCSRRTHGSCERCNLPLSLSNWALSRADHRADLQLRWLAGARLRPEFATRQRVYQRRGPGLIAAPGSPPRRGLGGAVKTDYQGALRPIGSGFDMGAASASS
jgi:hypothetical protein